MDTNVGIKDMLKLAIQMEADGVEYYTEMANKADEYHNNLMYKPRTDKLTWSEDKGFYVELAKRVLGEGYASIYPVSMPAKITYDDYAGFYYGLGKRVVEDVKSILLGMAEDEKRHGELFKKWLANVDENSEDGFAPEAAAFFDKYSKDLKFNTKESAPSSIAYALESAIGTEDGAVHFYRGMLEFASPGIAPMLEKIVSEEKGHKAKLEGQKARLDALTV